MSVRHASRADPSARSMYSSSFHMGKNTVSRPKCDSLGPGTAVHGSGRQYSRPVRPGRGELPVTIEDVRRAATAIEGDVVRTPTLRSETLSAITGAHVWLK